ncbi:helix-turn-helix domain-containing protein [Sphingomonas sp.]|uniref:helix-turn-helix domain-containing protein n=1 Tax=Sphingomonas sp. TaxID=28214 RepID=UPI00307F8B09
MNEKLTYTISEAASAAGVGRTKLYELINAGEIPLIKIGTRSLVRRSDVFDLLERNTVQNAA